MPEKFSEMGDKSTAGYFDSVARDAVAVGREEGERVQMGRFRFGGELRIGGSRSGSDEIKARGETEC